MRRIIEDISFKVGTFNILWMTVCLVLSTVLFFVDITIQWFTLPLVTVVAGVIYYLWFWDKKWDWRGIAFGVCLVAIAVLLSYLVFNIHWDGNTYHKTAIGLLMDGWNPIETDCTVVLPTDKITDGIRYNAQWINHYANGGWIISAVWSVFFQNIEIGKAVNLLNMISVFGVLFWYLSKKLKSRAWTFVVAGLAVFNPITVSQVESFYIDGSLYLYLLLGVLAMLMLSDKNCDIPKRYPIMFLFASIVYCINIKFTGMAYICFFCIGFYLCWLVAGWKSGRFKEVFVKTTLMFVGMAAFSILVVGYSSYVCNIIEKGNPLYPLVGAEKIDIMDYSEPNTFDERSGVEKSLVSFFGKTENLTNSSKEEPKLKIPFTISPSEIQNCMYTDARIGGFGPWFSGIFIISAMLSVSLVKDVRKKAPLLALEWSVTLSIALLMLLFFPASWWARYSAYIYFYVLSALFYLAKKCEEGWGIQAKIKRVLSKLFTVAVLFNTMCFLLAPAAGVYLSLEIWQDKKELQQAADEKELQIYCPTKQMTGVFWNLDCWGISYSATDSKIKGNKAYNDKIVWAEK